MILEQLGELFQSKNPNLFSKNTYDRGHTLTIMLEKYDLPPICCCYCGCQKPERLLLEFCGEFNDTIFSFHLKNRQTSPKTQSQITVAKSLFDGFFP